MNKRLVGMAALLAGRARRFQLGGVARLVEEVRRLKPDHILITGDLTTTALPDEFRAARQAMAGLIEAPDRVTVIPGNHDRYTWWAHRSRRFERYFGMFAAHTEYPWLRRLDPETTVLGLDPTRAGITARGKLPRRQIAEAQRLIANTVVHPPRLIVACHYPVAVPPAFERDLARKPMVNAEELRCWLRTIGPHLFCCGHVHAAWAFRPQEVPNQLCINPGPPLLPGHFGHNHPGFAEIRIEGDAVTVDHHAWTGDAWERKTLHRDVAFFQTRSGADAAP